MRKSLAIIFLFVSCLASAQSNINQYQYVIVPSQFKFTSKVDQYRLNTLTKLLLEKYGFKVYFDSETLPAAIVDSKCDKLYADVTNFGNFITTKMKVSLTDCNNKLIYETAVGTSREKEYRIAYTQALREAFNSFDSLHYHYVPASAAVVEKINSPKTATVIVNETFDDSVQLLYAQPIANGYQLVDATPKVVMKIFNTSSPNTYTAIKDNTQGVVISKDNKWFFEYYQDDKLVSERIYIRF